MFTEHVFYEANVYSTGSTADGYSYVTGQGTDQTVDGYKCLGWATINNTSSTIYALLYDGYAPSDATGHSPIASLLIAGNAQQSYNFGPVNCAKECKKGILIVYSSTPWSFTPVVTAAFTTCWWI